MRLQQLCQAVWEANKAIVDKGLVELTWGNVSGVDRSEGVMVIKPSGVSLDDTGPDDMVNQSIETGEIIGGSLRPSTDAPTHLALYRAFEGIGGIVHTHSPYATSWAQAANELPCLGTTHADHFCGPVPVTRRLDASEIADRYEENTGSVIVECFSTHAIDPMRVPGVLVAQHAPFTWGPGPSEAVENALVLESLARNALYTLTINPEVRPLGRALLHKHFFRKHGPDAYYGQGHAGRPSI